MALLQPLQPILDENANISDVQAFVKVGIFFEIRVREFEKRRRGAKPVFLQVDEGAGELDESFVKGVVGAAALRQPQFFEHVVRFKVEPAIEAFEISEVMRVQFLSLELFDDFRDGAAFFAHESGKGINSGDSSGKTNQTPPGARLQFASMFPAEGNISLRLASWHRNLAFPLKFKVHSPITVLYRFRRNSGQSREKPEFFSVTLPFTLICVITVESDRL
jgi:hypothetical protein